MFGLCVLVLFVLVALLAPVLASSQGLALTTAPGRPLEHPSSQFWLGTDQNGRSILTLLIWGSRVSLFVGLLATFISMVLGTLAGLASGHFRGWFGAAVFRVTEWFLVIPFLPLAIVLASLLGPSLLNTSIVIGVTGWPSTALLIRAQTLTVESRPYVERAKVLGAGHWHQMSRQVLPNVMPMVMANTTLTVAISILTETTLSFLGLGGSDRVSWGEILDQAFQLGAITNNLWWYFIPPGVCVIVVVLAFTLVGRALEDIFNPRLRER
jgi:peptide/nickel transport system permease protein